MARQVLPIVGAVVGAFFGAPQLGYAIGTIIGNAVDPLVINGPKIGDNGVQTAAEGAWRPVVYGTAPVVGNVICRGNRQIKKKKQRQSKGGPVTVTEHVYWTFAIRISEPVAALMRIWEDEKLVYDVRPGSLIPEESLEYANRFRFYDGNETQLPDPDLEVFLGMGNVPAYRGTAYIVFPNYDLTDRRESIPNYRFEVAASSDTEQGFEWLMSAGFTDSMFFKRSPDGIDWSADSTTEIPNLVNFYRDGDHVLGINGGTSKYSTDRGATFQSVSFSVFPSANSGNDRAGLIAGSWYVASSPGGSIKLDIESGLVTNVGWSALNLITYQDIMYTCGVIAHQVIIRDGSGLQIGTSAFRPPAQIATQRLGAGDGRVVILFNDEDSVPYLALIEQPNAIEIPCPFSTYNNSDNAFIHYSEGLDLWLVICGEHVAYGNDIEALTLSAYTFPTEIAVNNLDDDGTKFLIVGNNQLALSTVDGIVFTPITVSDTFAGTTINSVVSLEYSIEVIGQPIPLSSIISSIHNRANQSSSKYDVTELTDMVYGVVLAGDYTCAGSIVTIISPYFSDASEYGKKINYIKRGNPVVKTLTIDDLVEEPEDTMRDNQIEYPAKLHMFFQNPLIGYAPAKATTSRSSPDILVVGERTVQIPVVIDSVDEAAQISDKFMKTAWAEAGGTSTLTVSDAHMDLVNADTVGVFLRGQVSRRRIVKIEDNPGTRKLTLHNDRQSAVTSNVTGIPLPDPTPPLPSIAGLSVLGILDIPALTDQDDDLHYLTAVTGQTEGWHGAEVQRRLEGGTEFNTVAEFNTNTAMGVLLETVADASEFFTDTTNVIRIQLYLDDEIDSITQEQFLSEGNGGAIQKADGSWELIQFRDAVDEGGGMYALSYLQRGRLNSGTSEHEPGRLFVLFDFLRKVPAVTAFLETELTHRAVSYTTSPETAINQTDLYVGRSQMEFPVASFTAERIGDTITGTIVPRHRFGTEDNPVRSINWAGYEITASASGQTESIISTTEDFSIEVVGFASPVLLTISQLNRFPIPGPTVSEYIA